MYQATILSRPGEGETSTLSPGRAVLPRKSLAASGGRASSTPSLVARRKSVCSPDMLRALHRGQRRPQTAAAGAASRVRKQRPATASGAPLALLLGDEELSRRTRGDPLLQAIEDAAVKRQKGLLRCQSLAYQDWVVEKSEQAPEDLQELREKHNHVNRARRPQSSPASLGHSRGGRRQSIAAEGTPLRLDKRSQGWEALSPSQQLRSLGSVLETTGQRQPNRADVSGPDGFSRLLEAAARETGGKAREKVQDREDREKAEADRLMTRLVQVMLLSASTLKAAFDKLDSMGRGRVNKKDFDTGLRAMGFEDAPKDRKMLFRLLGFDEAPFEGRPSSPVKLASAPQLTFRDLEAKLSPFLSIVILGHQNAYRAQHGGDQFAILPHVDAGVDVEQLRVLQEFKQMLTNKGASDEPWTGRRARGRRGASMDLASTDALSPAPAAEKRKLFQGSTMTDAQREDHLERISPLATRDSPLTGRVAEVAA